MEKEKIELNINIGKESYAEALSIREEDWSLLHNVIVNEFKMYKKRRSSLNSMDLTKICCEKYATNITEVAMVALMVSKIYTICTIGPLDLMLVKSKEYKELTNHEELF